MLAYLFSFLLLGTSPEISARDTILENQYKIELSFKNEKIGNALETVSRQTKVRIVYSNTQVDAKKNISLKLKTSDIEEALRGILGEGYTFKQIDNYISIAKKTDTNKTGPGRATNQPPVHMVQQEEKRTITGQVTSHEKEPLAGVTIREKGTQTGTFSDENGRFSIDVSKNDAELIFSYIGFKTLEISTKEKNVIQIIMEENIAALDDVVVTVAYGIQSKVSITGAISTVTSDNLKKSSVSSFGNALQGRITGLSATQSGGGMPGLDDPQIYLRGAATLNGASPLILVDGVPRDLRTLDVTEVESVSVLKDASATAVFGVRGANGVILVTTKRGVEGKAQLSVSASQAFTSFTRKPERMSSLEYIRLRNEAYKNEGRGPAFSDDIIAKFQNPLSGLDPGAPDYAQQVLIRNYLYPNHYYYEEFFKTTAPETRINANVQGGTNKVLYFMNIGYLSQGGHFNTEPKSKLGYDPALKLDRWSFRANMDYKMSDVLKARFNIGTYIEKQNGPNYTGGYPNLETLLRGVMQDIFMHNPTIPGPTTPAGVNENVPGDAVVQPRATARSPYQDINRLGYYVYTRINLNTSIELELDLSKWITKGLSIKGMVSYDSYPTNSLLGQRDEKIYYADPDYENNRILFSEKPFTEKNMTLLRWTSSHYQINGQASINYSQQVGRHNIGGMLLAQRDYWESDGAEIPYNMISFAGRATYNYQNCYFAEFNIGYNGSEQFAPDNRYGIFPAFSAGWVATSENFLKDNNILTYFKLRGSYGKVGNDKLGNARFLYLDDIQLGGAASSVGGLGLGQQVYVNSGGNYDLQWEVANKFNIGADFQIIKDLNGSIDYFIEKRDKILLDRQSTPIFQGRPLSTVPKGNIGKVDNRGIELELSYSKEIIKDLHIRLKGNIGTNKNKIKFVDEVADPNAVYPYKTTGYPIGQSWGYLIDWKSPGKGYWTSQEEIDASGLTFAIGKPRPGDLKYIDLNGDNEISNKDYAPIGDSSIPGLTYGLDIGVEFKGFDFNAFFSGVGKYSTIWSGQGIYEIFGSGSYFGYHKNAWTKERFENGEKITYPALSVSEGFNHTPNEFFLQNRSFVRLKNLEVGYTLPKNSLKTIGISNLRLYVSGQNLLTWDKLNLEHQDPEKDNPTRYPITKLLGFGFNVTF